MRSTEREKYLQVPITRKIKMLSQFKVVGSGESLQKKNGLDYKLFSNLDKNKIFTQRKKAKNLMHFLWLKSCRDQGVEYYISSKTRNLVHIWSE